MARLLAALVLLGSLAVVPARAADPAGVAAVEQFLRDDEKALLAAVLVDKAASAEFDADVKAAGSDAKTMKLVLDKWRGRVAAFAESDAKHPTPDVEGVYKNYGAMMTPQIRAYLLRRIKTMKEADRNTLIEYLDGVNDALASNNGHLTWYTKKVVAGVFDKYRSELSGYLATPFARDGKAAAPAAEAALAKLRKTTDDAALADAAAREKAERERLAREKEERDRAAAARKQPPVAVSTPTAGGSNDGVTIVNPPVTETKPLPQTDDALEQARKAKEAAERAGGNFDGSTNREANTGTVAGGSGSGSSGSVLTPPSGLGAKPSLIGDVPSPNDPDDAFMSDIKKMKTGSGSFSPRKYLPAAAGAAVGALAGGLLFGLIGALVGLAVGALIGHFVGKKLFK